jgi:hypothetical protein
MICAEAESKHAEDAVMAGTPVATTAHRIAHELATESEGPLEPERDG